MSKIEREIKILDVNPKEIMDKMNELGVRPKGKYIQDIYTFELPGVKETYEKALKSAEVDNERERIIDLITDIRPCFKKEDLALIERQIGTKDLLEYVKKGDLSKIDNDNMRKLMTKVNANYSRWIRLRKTGNETTITIKKIVNCSGEYEIDSVKELEFPVPSIEDGKEFLKDIGYYPELHQKKMRIAYDFNDTEIVIDKWPKISPYIEIEGNEKEEIRNVAHQLGYTAKDIRVMNTDEVYKEKGFDIYSYKNLDFSEEEKEEVKEYLEYNPI